MTKTQDHTSQAPLSGGPKGALASRGAQAVSRALSRLTGRSKARR